MPPDRILVASSGQRRQTAPSRAVGHRRCRRVARVDHTAPRRYAVEAERVVGPTNLYGQNCHFTFKLTPLSPSKRIGVNLVFSFKKQG
jgi:hypothetical protein